MRVLHVVPGNLYGGIERYVVTLAAMWRSAPELEPQFALCYSGRIADELRATGRPIHNLGPARVRNFSTVRQARANFQALLDRERYCAVIVHSSWTQAICGPVLNRHHTPMLRWVHGPIGGAHWLDWWAMRNSTPAHVVFNSRFTAAATTSRFYPDLAREVLYYPVPAHHALAQGEREEIRRELATSERSVVMVQASRMEPWKGHLLHLEALSRLPGSLDWTCWQIGGPQRPSEQRYFNKLRRTTERLGIASRIRFAGERRDVGRLLQAADIHCQPNTGPEPFGIAFVEALHAGCPVVTTKLGAATEIVDPLCGILVPPGDAQALADALEELARNADRRGALGVRARQRAEEIGQPQRHFERLTNLVRNTLLPAVA